MKLRKGFVSNSSSSSYICDLCGRAEAGYDNGPQDFGMVECEKYHTMCEEHIKDYDREKVAIGFLKDKCIDEDDIDFTVEHIEDFEDVDFTELIKESLEKKKSLIKKYMVENEDYFTSLLTEFDEYELPTWMCPICLMGEVMPKDMVKYLLKSRNLLKKEVVREIGEKFESFDDFQKYLKED